MIQKNQMAAVGSWWLAVVIAWATEYGLIHPSVCIVLGVVLTASGYWLWMPQAERVIEAVPGKARAAYIWALDKAFPPMEGEGER